MHSCQVLYPLYKIGRLTHKLLQKLFQVNKYVWYVCAGQKFPSKSLEVSVQATLHFPEYPPPAPPEVNEDPFCVGLNSYADVSLTPHKHSISICILPVSYIGPSLVSFLASFPDHLQRKGSWTTLFMICRYSSRSLTSQQVAAMLMADLSHCFPMQNTG